MKRFFPILFILVMACKKDVKSLEAQMPAKNDENEIAQTTPDLPFEVYDYEGIEPLINKADDKIHVVNFWATWCAPCIKELPYFEKLQENYNDQNVELLLVSLDFPRQYKTKLVPFLEKKQIKAEVVALDDVDMNSWIPKVDNTWSGALPATIIYSGEKRNFYEQSFTYEELETEIKQFLN